MTDVRWHVLVGGRRILPGTKLLFGNTGLTATAVEMNQRTERGSRCTSEPSAPANMGDAPMAIIVPMETPVSLSAVKKEN